VPITESDRSLIGRIGAHKSWANTQDRSARTEPARRAMFEKFELEVDPNHELTPAERAKRAECARKEYYARLALKSAQARRRAKDAQAQANTVKLAPRAAVDLSGGAV
jgi:hypothetical protein